MTTIIIVVLKVFDIVFTMTNGQFQTEVLANYMFRWMFRNFDNGRGSMIAVTIMLAVTPFLIWNIIRFRREEEGR
jgi:alpha-glucoside transport system permease protein